jgi:hypothetical protein
VIFSLEILEKNNDEGILILVIYWKKTGLLHTKTVCLFSWRYNPLWLYFHSPVAGFSLLIFEAS